jgi:hypothetical protein
MDFCGYIKVFPIDNGMKPQRAAGGMRELARTVRDPQGPFGVSG